jgi:GTP-binding protein
MDPLFQAIVDHCPAPDVDLDGPFQLQVSAFDYSSYVGAIGIGRVTRGRISANTPVVVVSTDGSRYRGRMLILYGFQGLNRVEVSEVQAGDIIAFTGIERPAISDTLCDPDHPEALPALSVDEPTVSMSFQVNTSPFAGKEGDYLTSRRLRDRLDRELVHNVALRVEDTEDPDRFLVSGRGELHLGILIENMRREGYELAVSRPQVVYKEVDGQRCEPFEQLTVDVEEQNQGALMEALGARRADLQNMVPDGKGRVRLDYLIPSRGLIGFQTEFQSATSGTGLLYHVFDHYGPAREGASVQRKNGAMIAMATGKALGYALFNLQDRGRMMISPGQEVYEGQVIGIHARDNDLVVNPLKAKQLTNIRAAGTDENIILTPPMKLGLEQALEIITDDELVEVTPKSIRIRKRYLKEAERRRIFRGRG